ncbi:MAG: ABC transporter permease [Eubacteriales bacterium]|nr:ABC transporter permease [Eubacteriales bacterium]
MSFTLLKTTFKMNWKLLLIFWSVVAMYLAILVYMYDPEDMKALMSMVEAFPEDLMKAMGFSTAVADLTGYLASWLYGLLMFGIPMVYCIILGNRLVAKMVDNSSFAYLLTTPHSRVKIIVTQGVYALASVAVLFAVLYGTGVAICEAMFPGLLDIGAFLRLNITTMLINMAVMMISFFFSCLFNDTKRSLGFGSGIPIVFLLMYMLGGAAADAEIVKQVSIYGLYDPVELVQGGDVLGANLIYIGIAAVLFAAGVLIFKKKRLPL